MILAARKARGLTQHDLGGLIGATGNDVSRWENGRVLPEDYWDALIEELELDELEALRAMRSEKARRRARRGSQAADAH